MNRRSLALALACALSLSLLTSCGGGSSSSNQSGSSQSSSSVSSSADGSDISLPGSADGSSSQEDASSEGSSSSQGSASSGGSASSQPDASAPEQAAMTLNRVDFSLFTVGSTFRLKAANVPEGASVTWTSSNEAVATVGEDGTVTYVAPGSVTITAVADDQTVTCKVYCKAQEETKPEEETKPDGSGNSSSSSGDSSSSASKVDLSAFATTVIADYAFPSFMQLADKTLQDTFYPGLSDIATEQCLVYANQMSMNNGELVLVQVKDSKDVDAVKAILQTRVDNMANGGAWYPEPTRLWTECSQVVSNGNYVMMVVNESYSSVVEDFNALF